MLRAIPTGWWTVKYELLDSEVVVGLVEFNFGRDGAKIYVGNETYNVRGEGWFSREYHLESPGNGIIASAGNPAFSGRFAVNFGNRSYSLEKESGLLNQNYILVDGTGVLGSIRRDSFFSRKSTIDISHSFPLPFQAFMFTLVALLWKRASDSAAAAT
jgi:hypothetical protein